MSLKLSIWAAIAAPLVILKLAGAVGASWWIVLLPIWGPIALALLLIAISVGAAAAGSLLLAIVFGTSAEERGSSLADWNQEAAPIGQGGNLSGAPYVSNVRRYPRRSQEGD